MQDAEVRVAVITGATSGIGKAIAVGLAAAGLETVIVSRSAERGAAAAAEIARKSGHQVRVVIGDLASQSSVRTAASEILDGCPSVHVLVNNAGLISRRREITEDGFEASLAVSHFGHYTLTGLLMPALLNSDQARIVNLASSAHYLGDMRWNDLRMEQWYDPITAYGRAKLANVLFTMALARRLGGTRVTTTAVHPGAIRSGLWRAIPPPFRWIINAVLPSAEQGAVTPLFLAIDPATAGVNGEYWAGGKRRSISPVARDVEEQERLWALSRDLTGVTYPLEQETTNVGGRPLGESAGSMIAGG
jgi:NAD(P)-dependent dehydrogenase (short-subunit alcohol dehydrogenase family)